MWDPRIDMVPDQQRPHFVWPQVEARTPTSCLLVNGDRLVHD